MFYHRGERRLKEIWAEFVEGNGNERGSWRKEYVIQNPGACRGDPPALALWLVLLSNCMRSSEVPCHLWLRARRCTRAITSGNQMPFSPSRVQFMQRQKRCAKNMEKPRDLDPQPSLRDTCSLGNSAALWRAPWKNVREKTGSCECA